MRQGGTGAGQCLIQIGKNYIKVSGGKGGQGRLIKWWLLLCDVMGERESLLRALVKLWLLIEGNRARARPTHQPPRGPRAPVERGESEDPCYSALLIMRA